MKGDDVKVDRTHRELQHGKVGDLKIVRLFKILTSAKQLFTLTFMLRGIQITVVSAQITRPYFVLRAFMTLLYFVRIELCVRGGGGSHINIILQRHT